MAATRFTAAPDWSGKADDAAASSGADSSLVTLTGSPVYATSTLPTGSSAKVLNWAENTAGTFKYTTWSGKLAASGTGATVLFWAKLRATTPGSIVEAATPATNGFFRINSGSILQWYFSKVRERVAATYPGQITGLSQSISTTAGSGSINTGSETFTTEPNMNSTGAGTLPTFPTDRWVRVAVRCYRHATLGRCTAYLDGQIIAEATNLNTDSGFTTMTTFTNGWTFNLPAIAGCAWSMTQPEEWSDDGTFTEITELSPNWTWGAHTTSDTLKRWDLLTFMDAPMGTAVTSSGTATATVTNYGTSGDHPGRNYLSIAGTNGQSKVITHLALGSPSYGAGGYYTVVFPMTYSPASTTHTIAVRNAGNTADLATVVFGATNITVNGQTLAASYDKTLRWRVALQFGQGGDLRAWAHREDAIATYSLRDYTAVIAGGWTPQTLGIVTQTMAFTGSTTGEHDGLGCFSTLEIGGVDSYTHTTVTSLTPVLGLQQHYLQFLGGWRGAELHPGCPTRGNDATTARPRRYIFPVGASGHTLSQFRTECVAGLTELRGYKLWLPGTITNDINQGGTTEAQMDTVRTTAISDMRAILRQVVASTSEAVVCSTLPWNFETTIDGTTIKVDRSGTTATVTCASHGYLDAYKITFCDMSNSALDKQSAVITYVNANSFTYTTSTSGSITGASGKMRYFNDEQIKVLKRWNVDLKEIIREEQLGTRLSYMPIGECLPVSAKAFSLGFTNEAHPSDAKKFTAVEAAFSSYQTESVSTPTGYKRQGKKDNWFKNNQ